MRIFYHIGKYILLMFKVFSLPEKFGMFYRQITKELENLGFSSIGIIGIISVFVGAAVTIQASNNIENPLLPRYLVGVAVRDGLLLEFSPTMVALILAGKVGSSISSEIGTMRVTEQIDALEIMGVNSASYLILPKIIASIFFFPLLCILSIVVGILGGFVTSMLTSICTPQDYIYGLQYVFYPHYFTYALKKMIVFAFIISSISSYHGYFVEGGSIEVGKSSTRAVVYSSVVVLLFNLILTQLILL
jgi:phospholipid/cholesterol/gamma-HCH transport system permease protein